MGDRVQEAKEEGIRQGIWLCIQKLVELERFDMAKYFMISFGFNKNECHQDKTAYGVSLLASRCF